MFVKQYNSSVEITRIVLVSIAHSTSISTLTETKAPLPNRHQNCILLYKFSAVPDPESLPFKSYLQSNAHIVWK